MSEDYSGGARWKEKRITADLPPAEYRHDMATQSTVCYCSVCDPWSVEGRYACEISEQRAVFLSHCREARVCFRCFEFEWWNDFVPPIFRPSYTLNKADAVKLLLDHDPRIKINRQYLLDLL